MLFNNANSIVLTDAVLNPMGWISSDNEQIQVVPSIPVDENNDFLVCQIGTLSSDIQDANPGIKVLVKEARHYMDDLSCEYRYYNRIEVDHRGSNNPNVDMIRLVFSCVGFDTEDRNSHIIGTMTYDPETDTREAKISIPAFQQAIDLNYDPAVYYVL